VKKQIFIALLGLVGMMAASFFLYRWYKKWGPFVAYGLSIVLLIAVLFVGKSEGEAKRWIGVGSFTVQPSELMKISLVLILAWYIDKFKPKMEARLNPWHTVRYNVLGPCVFVGAACMLILMEKHLSGTLITGIVAFAVMIVGGCHFGWTTLICGIAGTLMAGIFLLVNPYALKRITTFTDENADKLDELYQTTQSIYAIGSGGLDGLGFGKSWQKHGYVGAAHTDFIFAIWCEEMGFIGGVLLIGLFLAFIWRGYVIASRAPDTFSMLTAFGITTHVGLQAFLNMCVAADIIPNTGISLPFFSYGGSSLLVLLCEMGLLLSISRQYYRKKADLEREQLLKELD
jgi:cell division protein FtsW